PQLERCRAGDLLGALLAPDPPDVLIVDPDRELGQPGPGDRDHAARCAAYGLVADVPGASRAVRPPQQRQRGVRLRRPAVPVAALQRGSRPAAKMLAVP